MIKILFSLVMLLTPITASSYNAHIDGIYYNINWDDKTAEVTCLQYYSVNNKEAYKGQIVLPETITYNNQKITVNSIGDCAFMLCSELTSIIISSNIVKIGYCAFRECTGLTSIIIPKNVSSIGEAAFYLCSELTSIKVDAHNNKYDSRGNCNAVIETQTGNLIFGCKSTRIPNGVTSIGEMAFYGCTGLTSITIPNSVNRIDYVAFRDCSGLTSLVVPSSVTSIGESAFVGCTGLTELIISEEATSSIENMTSIGESAFAHCYELKDVIIGDGVKTIGESAFSYCTSLNSIVIGCNVDSIDLILANCPSLSSIKINENNHKYDSRGGCNAIIVTKTNSLFLGCKSTVIPNTITSIAEHAFWGSNLTSLDIPNSVTHIGKSAFSHSSLQSISIPNSVTEIEDYSFFACYQLASVIIGSSVKTIGKYAFANSYENSSVTIPDNVTSVGEGAFSGCIKLASVIIGSGVRSIGESAFDRSNLKKIVSRIESPVEIPNNAFSDNTYSNATLYVPIGKKANYQAQRGWFLFYNIEEGDGKVNGVTNVKAAPVSICGKNGLLTIQDAEKGEEVHVYSMTGMEVGEARVTSEITSIATCLKSGDVAIVKIGNNSLKVSMK